MTVDAEVLAALADQVRRMTAGFGNELAVVWPVLRDGMGQAVIASVGDGRHVRVVPARVFRYALRAGATGVVLAHNHATRSGPSLADQAATCRLVAAGHILGIPLVAHLVVEPGAVHELVSAGADALSAMGGSSCGVLRRRC